MRRSALAAAGAALTVATLASGCGGGGGAAPPPPATTGGTDPLARGKAVFLGVSGCARCHTLADAGATGTIASSLDEKRPTAARVQEVLAKGSGAMPSYAKQLSAQEIAWVTAYVAARAGR